MWKELENKSMGFEIFTSPFERICAAAFSYSIINPLTKRKILISNCMKRCQSNEFRVFYWQGNMERKGIKVYKSKKD